MTLRQQFAAWRRSNDYLQFHIYKLRQQNHCCAICKETLRGKQVHCDHIKPLSKFPELALEPSNMQLSCSDCNLKKGSKTE